MKNTILIIAMVFLFLSCNDVQNTNDKTKSHETIYNLPYHSIELNDLDVFEKTSSNWKVVEEVKLDQFNENVFDVMEGLGVLVNLSDDKNKSHLITTFDHGDIELEFDVMMPKESNSGVYFQGRYEVQLFDSWGQNVPSHSDMGGIYERWDERREDGEKGFEGHSPKINAAKSPGLWQHVKIIFHAPKFDSSGKKIKNANFEEVWLNGELVQKNVDVTGPTRSGIADDEVEMAPLMIQGDHGQVAFKNLRYKLYDSNRIFTSKLSVREYDYKGVQIPNLDSLQPLRVLQTDSISSSIIKENRVFRLLDYKGTLIVPESGDYLFDARLHSAGALLIIQNDTVINRNRAYELDDTNTGLVNLTKGEVPFQFIYNKSNQWTLGFQLNYEGPGIQYQSLSSPESLIFEKSNEDNQVVIEVDNEVVMQRGFLMFTGNKRTHCIAVGTPEKTHYSYDLAAGSLLAAWNGPFYDVTEMWYNRGIEQLGKPLGFTMWFAGEPQFSALETDNSDWPAHDYEVSPQNYDGYELDTNGFPIFLRKVSGVQIKDKFVPTETGRGLERTINTKGDSQIWHKIGEGNSIKKITDDTYRIDGTNYFVQVLGDGFAPIIRKKGEKEEMLVKLSTDKQSLQYRIIW
ncbi:DUF1080 domain-containing protein [Pseudozobellia sp. WGM2]|uniref:3-keto-disaccharide hydrolase n=1 Tax=Pseudozobellia sp. WGM2 TaxID=2787625 RepID=UPI001ADF6F44|nr:DUF1080 domain-containing protein [Pseudozobellia sp. WGM2]